MRKCMIHHTGVMSSAYGVIKDNKLYLVDDDDKLYLPDNMFMAVEECEGGLIQFEVNGKWGFADIYTGEIVIEPVWDYVGPFYKGYAHVALNAEVEHDKMDVYVSGGSHGYIDMLGRVVIPLEYSDAGEIPYRNMFEVAKDGKWGIITRDNKLIIPFEHKALKTDYDHDLVICSIIDSESCKNVKWGIYHNTGKMLMDAELTEEPYYIRSTAFSYGKKYMLLQKDSNYGVFCMDGRLISNIVLSKEEARSLIDTLNGEYIHGYE